MCSTLHRCPTILSALVSTMSKDGCHVRLQYPEGFFPVSTFFFNTEPFLYPQVSISTSPVRAQSQRIKSRVRKREERLFFFLDKIFYFPYWQTSMTANHQPLQTSTIFDADQCMSTCFCISKYTMQPILTPNPSNTAALCF